MKHQENVEVIKKYLAENEWHCKVTEYKDLTLFEGGVKPEYASLLNAFRFRLVVDDTHAQVFFYLPISAKMKLVEVAEYITRVNYMLKFGRFDMDFLDGEVRFHHIISMIGIHANPTDMLHELLITGGTITARYAEGVAKIVYGSVDPKTALDEIEAGE